MGETLIPSLLSSDLAQIHGNLTQVLKKRKNWKSIVLVNKNNVRLFPINLPSLNENNNLTIFEKEIVYKDEVLGKINVTANLDGILAHKINKIRALEKWVILSILIIIFISFLFVNKWIKKPINEIILATSKVAQGEFNYKLPDNLTGELFEFVTSFDQMRAILKSRDEKIKRQQKISDAIREVQTSFITKNDCSAIFKKVLENLIDLTNSKFGFIGEIFYDDSGNPYLETYALSNIAWDVESRKLFEQSIDGSIRFTNTKTLFGEVMISGKPLICNEPANDPRSGGTPPGHPELTSFFGMPLYNRKSKLMGMFAVANANDGYLEKIIHELNVLWLVIGNLFEAQQEQLALIDSEDNLRAIVDNAIEAIITINENGDIQTFNPAAEGIFGYSEAEVKSQNIKLLMPPVFSSDHDSYLNNYLTGGRAKIIGVGREVTGLRKNTKEFPMELSVAEFNKNGKRNFIGIVRDITERKQKESELNNTRDELFAANEKLNELVRTDSLTGIANRRHYDETIALEFRIAARHEQEISLLMLDIDYFKKYNDHYGHAEGDQCLRDIANELKTLFQRSGELFARYGGEEFVIILPQTPENIAIKMAEAILEKVRELALPHTVSSFNIVTVSIGLTTMIPKHSADKLETFQKQADDALYKAKEHGRNQAAIYKAE